MSSHQFGVAARMRNRRRGASMLQGIPTFPAQPAPTDCRPAVPALLLLELSFRSGFHRSHGERRDRADGFASAINLASRSRCSLGTM